MAQYSDYDVIAPLMMTEEGRDILLRNGYKIHDGDTVTTPDGQTIRISGINTAEVANSYKGTEDQPMGRLSQNAMAHALNQGEVTADITGKGKYGRNVGTLQSGLGDVNEYMVANHYAPSWDQYDKGHKLEKATAQNRADWAFDRPHPVKEFIEANYGGGTGEIPHIAERVRHHQGMMGRAMSRGIDSLQSGLYGVAHLGGRAIGSEDVQDWAEEGIVEQERQIAEKGAEVHSFRDIDDLGSFGTFALEKTIENLPILASGGASGLAARVAGKGASRQIAKGIREEALERSIALGRGAGVGVRTTARQAGREAGVKLLNRRTAIGSGAAFTAINTGETENEQRQLDNPANPALVAAAGLIKGAGDVLALSTILKKSLGVAKATGVMDAANKVAIGIGAGALAEAPIEAAQSAVDVALRAYQDPQFELMGDRAQERVLEAFVTGGVVGGVIGGVGSGAGMAADAISNMPERPPSDQPPPSTPDTPPQGGLLSPAPNVKTADTQRQLASEISNPHSNASRYTAAHNLMAVDPNVTQEVLDDWLVKDPNSRSTENAYVVRQGKMGAINEYYLSRGHELGEGHHRSYGDSQSANNIASSDGSAPIVDNSGNNMSPTSIGEGQDNFDSEGNPINSEVISEEEPSEGQHEDETATEAEEAALAESIRVMEEQAAEAEKVEGLIAESEKIHKDEMPTYEGMAEEELTELRKKKLETRAKAKDIYEDTSPENTQMRAYGDTLLNNVNKEIQAIDSALAPVSKQEKLKADQKVKKTSSENTTKQNLEKKKEEREKLKAKQLKAAQELLANRAKKSTPEPKAEPTEEESAQNALADANDEVDLQKEMDFHLSLSNVVGKMTKGLQDTNLYGKLVGIIERATPNTETVVEHGMYDEDGSPLGNINEVPVPHSIIYHSARGKSTTFSKGTEPKHFDDAFQTMTSALNTVTRVAQDVLQSRDVELLKLSVNGTWGRVTAKQLDPNSKAAVNDKGTAFILAVPKNGEGTLKARAEAALEQNHSVTLTPQFSATGKQSYVVKAESFEDANMGNALSETKIAAHITKARQGASLNKGSKISAPKIVDGKDTGEKTDFNAVEITRLGALSMGTTVTELSGQQSKKASGLIQAFLSGLTELSHAKPTTTPNGQVSYGHVDPMELDNETMVAPGVTWGALKDSQTDPSWMDKTRTTDKYGNILEDQSMMYDMPTKKSNYDKKTTTIKAVKDGVRTSTTRKDGGWIGEPHVGDIVTFTDRENEKTYQEWDEKTQMPKVDKDGNEVTVKGKETRVDVLITKVHRITRADVESEEFKQQWMEKEGWNESQFLKHAKVGSLQIEFTTDIKGYQKDNHLNRADPDRAEEGNVVDVQARDDGIGGTVVKNADGTRLTENPHATKEENKQVAEKLASAVKPTLESETDNDQVQYSGEGTEGINLNESEKPDSTPTDDPSTVQHYAIYENEGTAAEDNVTKTTVHHADTALSNAGKAWLKILGIKARTIIADVNGLKHYNDELRARLKEAKRVQLETQYAPAFLDENGQPETVINDKGESVPRVESNKDKKIRIRTYNRAKGLESEIKRLHEKLGKLRDRAKTNDEPLIVYNSEYTNPELRVPIIFIPDSGDAMTNLTHLAHEMGHLIQRVAVDQLIQRHKKGADEEATKIVLDLFGEVKWDDPAQAQLAREIFADRFLGWVRKNVAARTATEAWFEGFSLKIKSMWEEMRGRIHANRNKLLGIKENVYDKRTYTDDTGKTSEPTVKVDATAVFSFKQTDGRLALVKDIQARIDTLVKEERALKIKLDMNDTTKYKATEGLSGVVKLKKQVAKTAASLKKAKKELKAKETSIIKFIERNREQARKTIKTSKEARKFAIMRFNKARKDYKEALERKADGKTIQGLSDAVGRAQQTIRDLDANIKVNNKPVPRSQTGIPVKIDQGKDQRLSRVGFPLKRYTKIISVVAPDGTKTNHLIRMGDEVLFTRNNETAEDVDAILQMRLKTVRKKAQASIDGMTQRLETEREELRLAKIDNEASLKEYEDTQNQLKLLQEELNSIMNRAITRGIEQADNFDQFLDALVKRANGPTTTIDGAMQTKIGRFRLRHQVSAMIQELLNVGAVHPANEMITRLNESKDFLTTNPTSKYEDIVGSLALGESLPFDRESVSTDAFGGADIVNAARGSNVGRATLAGAGRLAAGLKKWDKAYKSADRTLRGFGSHTATLIAREFRVRSNEAGLGTVFERQQSFRAEWYHKMGDVVALLPKPPSWLDKKKHPIESELAENKLKEIQAALIGHTPIDGVPRRSQAEVRAVRAYFKKLWTKYHMALGLDFQEDYFPLVLETQTAKWLADEKKIIDIFVAHGFEKGEAKILWEDMAESDGQVDPSVNLGLDRQAKAPGMRAKLQRGFSPELRVAMTEYYAHDLNGLITGYTDALGKRMSWQERFGGYVFNQDGSQKLEEVWEEDPESGIPVFIKMQPEWNPTARLNFMLDYAVNSDVDSLTKKQRDWIIDKALPAYKGTLGASMDPTLRKAQSGVLTALTVGLLSGATFTSAPDLAGIYIRLGETDGYKRSLKGFLDTLKYLKDPRYADEAKNYASMLLTIHDGLVDHTLSSAMEVGYMPKTAKKINETFFRAILLKKWTDFTRIMAVQVAKDDIRHLYETGNTKKLARLGLKPEHVEKWLTDGLDSNTIDQAQAQRVSPEIRMGINRWVDQAIMRPDPTKRPTVGSDARANMFFFLREFMYTFYETIIDQTITNTRDANGLAKAIPVIALGATVMPLAAAGYELRKLLFGKLPAAALDIKDTTREYYGLDYLSEVARRSGIYGPLQLIDDANTDRTRGNNVMVNLMGVPFEKAVQFIDDPYKALIKTTPIIAQSSPLKNMLY